MTDDAFMSNTNPFKSSTVYEARVSVRPSIFSRKRKPCASEGEDRRMSEFESESTVGEFDDLGFDFEIVDTAIPERSDSCASVRPRDLRASRSRAPTVW